MVLSCSCVLNSCRSLSSWLLFGRILLLAPSIESLPSKCLPVSWTFLCLPVWCSCPLLLVIVYSATQTTGCPLHQIKQLLLQSLFRKWLSSTMVSTCPVVGPVYQSGLLIILPLLASKAVGVSGDMPIVSLMRNSKDHPPPNHLLLADLQVSSICNGLDQWVSEYQSVAKVRQPNVAFRETFSEALATQTIGVGVELCREYCAVEVLLKSCLAGQTSQAFASALLQFMGSVISGERGTVHDSEYLKTVWEALFGSGLSLGAGV